MSRIAVFLFLILQAFQVNAAPRDVQGSSDHPMFSRYPGTTIVQYQQKDYEEYKLALSAPDGNSIENSLKKSQDLEGKLTRIIYNLEPGGSTLKVFRNFQRAIKKAGLQTLFQCKKLKCGYSPFWRLYFNSEHTYGEEKTIRYSAAKLKRKDNDVYVALFVVQRKSGEIYIALDIVETKTMETSLVTVNPKSLVEKLQSEGKVAIYGIYFDTNKAIVKPESDSAMQAIAKMLSENPKLKLYVVGHTDDTGSREHNQALSLQRAQAVIDELQNKYSIRGKGRLLSHGAGPYAPVASNLTDEGKGKNRRVELVQRLR